LHRRDLRNLEPLELEQDQHDTELGRHRLQHEIEQFAGLALLELSLRRRLFGGWQRALAAQASGAVYESRADAAHARPAKKKQPTKVSAQSPACSRITGANG